MRELIDQIALLWDRLEDSFDGVAAEVERKKTSREGQDKRDAEELQRELDEQRELFHELISSRIVDTADTLKILQVSNPRLYVLVSSGRLKPILRTRACSIFLKSDVEAQAKAAALYRERMEEAENRKRQKRTDMN